MLQKLIVAFVTLILGLSFVVTIADTGDNVTSKLVSSPQTFTILYLDGVNVNTTARYYPTVATQAITGIQQDIDGCTVSDVMTSSAIANASGTALTLTTDYVANSAGYLTFQNTTAVRGTTNTTVGTFTYCGNDYLAQGWTRSIINLIPGFFALALLVFSVGMFYSVAKDAGLI